MKQRITLALLALAVTCGTAFGQAGEVVKMVPNDAWAFGIVNRIGATDEQFMKLTKKLEAPLPGSPLDQFKQFFGITKGLNMKGTAGAIIMEGPGGGVNDPAAVLILPVTDYNAFVKGLGVNAPKGKFIKITTATGQDALVTQRGKFALLAEAKHRAALQKVLTTQGIVNQTKSLHKWLAEVDGAAVGTQAGVKFACKSGRDGINTILQFANPQTEQEKLGIQMLEKFVDWLKTVESNVTVAAVGGQLNAGGNLRISMRSGFVKGGSFAKASAAIKTPKGGLLAGLPDGPLAMTVGMTFPKDWVEGLAELGSLGVAADPNANVTAEQRKKLKEIFRSFYQMESTSMAIYGSKKKGALMSGNLISIMRVPNAEKYVDTYVTNIKAMQKIMGGVNAASLPSYDLKKMKLQGRTVLQLTQAWKKEQFQTDEQEAIMKAMFGPKLKMTMSLVAVDNNTIVSAAVPAKQLGKVLARYKNQKKSLSERGEVKKLLARLPEGSQWIMIKSPYRIAEMVIEGAKRFNPNLPKIPPFPKTPAIGMGMRVSSSGCDTEIVVPLVIIERAVPYFKKLERVFGGAI